MSWKLVSSTIRFENDHLSVTSDEVLTPGRTEPTPWTVVHRKRAVGIAAITAEDKIILIRQERIPIRATIWEVPAGQIDEPGEVSMSAIEAVALRELREETGFELAGDGKLLLLGDYFTSPGMTDERVYFFLARPVQLAARGSDGEDSILDCRAFSTEELIGMINRNEIRDANTLSICARLMAKKMLIADR